MDTTSLRNSCRSLRQAFQFGHSLLQLCFAFDPGWAHARTVHAVENTAQVSVLRASLCNMTVDLTLATGADASPSDRQSDGNISPEAPHEKDCGTSSRQ